MRGDPDVAADLAREIGRTMQDIGFYHVAGHGVPVERYSLAAFFNPNFTTRLSLVRSCVDALHALLFAEMTYEDYLGRAIH